MKSYLVFIFILAFSPTALSQTENNEKGRECVFKNPYPDGGRYAGYEWAERKRVTSCGGNSDSFIKGCNEYLRQIDECKRKMQGEK